MKSKAYYEEIFSPYPDMVDTESFRVMLGGIGDCFARQLIRQKKVTAVFVKPHYWISKKSIIDFLRSEEYQRYRLKVRV